MSDAGDVKDKGEKPKFVLRLPKTFDLELPTLGWVKVKYLTSKGDIELRKSLPDMKHASDEEVCRAYIGIVCEVDASEDDKASERRLGAEELASLTKGDPKKRGQVHFS